MPKLRGRLGEWDRILAALATGVAGFLVATHPAPSIDSLIGGWPATFMLGATLCLGATLNLVGLLKPSLLLQPVGLLLQLVPLLLLALGLFGLGTASAWAVGLLIVALACRVIHQYRLLKVGTAIVAAVAARDTQRPESDV